MFYILCFVAVLIFYFYTTRSYRYWAIRNVKHENPVPIFGNHWKSFFGIESIASVVKKMYIKYKDEKVIGYYLGNTPALIIKDPDLARLFFIADFRSFYIRGYGRNSEKEFLHLNLFHSEGDIWKLQRQRLTSAFTTNKLKNMFPLIVNCAEKLNRVADKLAEIDEEYDMREMMARFTTEFIGACGFGIEMDSINNERSQFRELGKKIFDPPLKTCILIGLIELFPELAQTFSAGQKVVEDAMLDIFRRIRNQRKGKPIGRNDFIDLLLEMEGSQKITGESIEHNNPDGTAATVSMKMTVKCMTAQLYLFFAAGFETSSSATSFLLHQLAFHPDIQSRIQTEIDQVMARYENKICYEAISEMILLEKAFKESMRMLPASGCLQRVCARKYTIPGLDITIDPGTKIFIPVQAYHDDEQYFENPKEFYPDRFSLEEDHKRHKFVYLPFGGGPRACIGARLGTMQSLAGVATLLRSFTFEPSKSSKRHPELNHYSKVVQCLKNGVPLKIRKRNAINSQG